MQISILTEIINKIKTIKRGGFKIMITESGTLLTRGTVVLIDFGSGEGCEQNNIRPALIVSNDVCNRYSPVITVAPITSKVLKKRMPTHIFLSQTSGKYPIHRDSVVMMEQIRAVDRRRICSKALFNLPEEDIRNANIALSIQLGLVPSKNINAKAL